MRYAVLGTGMVGRQLGGKLVELGHEVMMGSRGKDNPAALEWAREAGPRASTGTFAEAAEFGDAVIEAVGGQVARAALEAAGAERLAGKLVIDVSNPLEMTDGDVRLVVPEGQDSVGAQLQRAFPEARVVKTLNTLNASVMTDPALVPGEHQVFVSGDDAAAKREAVELLGSFGWPAERVIDLGGIESARAVELMMPLWLTLFRKHGDAMFNWQIQRASS
ncbi:NADPH-dependent F420 reductase [Streptomyces sp. NPDC059009]|uniref:NADPH-dependent F420 reductase n=1 Tax=Streptomyces sp. NPDC059009 TaxID=3346694 RepID=UPI0036A536BC